MTDLLDKFNSEKYVVKNVFKNELTILYYNKLNNIQIKYILEKKISCRAAKCALIWTETNIISVWMSKNLKQYVL